MLVRPVFRALTLGVATLLHVLPYPLMAAGGGDLANGDILDNQTPSHAVWDHVLDNLGPSGGVYDHVLDNGAP